MSSRLNSPWLTLVVSIVLVTALWALLLWKPPSERKQPPLVLLCAEALREPMKEIVPRYEQEFGQHVEVRLGASRELLTDLELGGQGDLFLPADDSYIADAEAKGLMGRTLPVGRMNAIIVRNIHSPKAIHNWDDLFRNGVRFALPNVKAAAVSRLTAEHLGEARFNALRRISVELGPVTQTANAVNLGGEIDAGLIWDNMLAGGHLANLKKVEIKEMEGSTATVRIGVVKKSSQVAAAERFAQFVSGCTSIFEKNGFTVTGITP